MANTFRKIYKKTGNSGSASDYQLVGNVGVDGVELDLMKGATSDINGEIGLVPKPIAGQEDYLLRGNGVWTSVDTVLKESPFIGDTSISDIDDGTITGILNSMNEVRVNIFGSSNSSNFKGLYLRYMGGYFLFFIWCDSNNLAAQNKGFWTIDEYFRPTSAVSGTCIAFTPDGTQNVVGLNINTNGEMYHTSSTARSMIIGLIRYDQVR